MSGQKALFDVYRAGCPSRAALDRVADKWTVLVIGALEQGPRRFSDLRRINCGISQKMLTQTLRCLERDGLVSRCVFDTQPPSVEYSLTPLGSTLITPLRVFVDWAETHIETILDAQAAYDSRQPQLVGDATVRGRPATRTASPPPSPS
ncbi:MAG: winged helix-turn-helix transcriptional regulator [Acidimicrobiia bacterium]